MKLRLGKRSKSREPSIMTERQARWVSRIFTGFQAIFVLLGIFFTVQGVLEWDRAAKSASWPTVAGTVTRSEVTSHRSTHKGRTSTSYHAHIEFDYEVDGRALHGNQRTYKVMASSQSAANEAVAAYPVGRSVNVSYDPQDPERAVLEPGWDWSNAIPIAVGLFAIAFVSFVRWLVERQLRKAVQRMRDLQALSIDPKAIEALADQMTAGNAASTAEPAATQTSSGSADAAAPAKSSAPVETPAKSSGPAELKPTFHDDLPGAR